MSLSGVLKKYLGRKGAQRFYHDITRSPIEQKDEGNDEILEIFDAVLN